MSRIIIPVSGHSVGEVERLVYRARAEHADLVELRLDSCVHQGADPLALLACIREWPLPVIVTNRLAAQGGDWDGDEEQRLDLLRRADAAGAAYIDVELACYAAFGQAPSQARLILSHHDFQGMGGDLDQIVRDMFAAKADIAKVAVSPGDAADLDVLAELCARHGRFAPQRDRSRGLIALGMGEFGFPSRVLAGAWGAAMTFARLASDMRGSAPGQPTVRDLTRMYRVAAQGPETCIFGVLGDPVGHSLSPAMHNAAFAHHGIDAVYVPFRASDAGAFWKACGGWIDGLSITIPHKGALLDSVDDVEDPVRAIGAMNTIFRRENGSSVGANTDAPAVITCLEETIRPLCSRRALVLGAGGVGHAVAYALRQAGCEVIIVNRTEARAQALAATLDCAWLSQDKAHEIPYDILVNATSVGMNDPDTSPWPATAHRQDSVVFDTVYTPLETCLLRDAADAGAATVCGLSMLEQQAAGQYQLWTGIAAPLARMHRAALEGLGTRWTTQLRHETEGRATIF